MDEDDNELFPEGFFDIGNKTFRWVLVNKPLYAEFSRTEMKKTTGCFLKWQSYCLRQSK